jgi:hypothetical protein
MEPGETLGIAAQIAVALAGFAGVVVVFGRVSAHEWSPIDKFRLRQLLTNSMLPLAFCMIGLLLLAIRPALGEVWRWCSGAAFVILLQFCIGSVKVFRRLDPQKLQRSVVSRSFFYLGPDCSDAIATVQRCPAKCVLAVFHRNRCSAHWRDVSVCADDSSAAGRTMTTIQIEKPNHSIM